MFCRSLEGRKQNTVRNRKSILTIGPRIPDRVNHLTAQKILESVHTCDLIEACPAADKAGPEPRSEAGGCDLKPSSRSLPTASFESRQRRNAGLGIVYGKASFNNSRKGLAAELGPALKGWNLTCFLLIRNACSVQIEGSGYDADHFLFVRDRSFKRQQTANRRFVDCQPGQ